MSDIEIIRAAIKTLLKLAEGMKWGGLLKEYELAKQALEALNRIEKPSLPGIEL